MQLQAANLQGMHVHICCTRTYADANMHADYGQIGKFFKTVHHICRTLFKTLRGGTKAEEVVPNAKLLTIKQYTMRPQ